MPLGGNGATPLHANKLLHVLAYLSFSTFFAQLLHGRSSRRLLVLALLGFGVRGEALQSQLLWRTAEFADLLANAVGIALGLLLTAGRGSRLLLALEHRWV